jgi:hypothetical protein
MRAADDMAVAATNCRRDSFRDIVSLHNCAIGCGVLVSCASLGCAKNEARKPICRIGCSNDCINELNGLAAAAYCRCIECSKLHGQPSIAEDDARDPATYRFQIGVASIRLNPVAPGSKRMRLNSKFADAKTDRNSSSVRSRPPSITSMCMSSMVHRW